MYIVLREKKFKAIVSKNTKYIHTSIHNYCFNYRDKKRGYAKNAKQKFY